MDNGIAITPAPETRAYVWFGIFNHRYRLVGVEQAEYTALEIAARLSKSGGSHHVSPVHVMVVAP